MKERNVFHTCDDFCLIKLAEIGKSTLKRWGKAMGYKNTPNMSRTIKNNLDKLKITNASTGKLKFYEIKEGVVLDGK